MLSGNLGVVFPTANGVLFVVRCLQLRACRLVVVASRKIDGENRKIGLIGKSVPRLRRPHANVNVMQTQLNSKVAHRKLFTISAAATIVGVGIAVSVGVDVNCAAFVLRTCVCLGVFVSWRCDFSPALVGCVARHAAACFFRDLHSSDRGSDRDSGSGRGRDTSRGNGRGSGRGCVTSSSFRLSGATTRRQLHKNATTQKQPVAHLSQPAPSPPTCPPLLSPILPGAALRCSAHLCRIRECMKSY